MKPDTRFKLKKVGTISGGILVLFPGCVAWVWGNLSVYVYSYFYVQKNYGSYQVEAPWLISVYDAIWTSGLILASVVHRCLGRRLTLILCMVLCSVGIFASFFAFNANISLLNLTLGGLNAFGNGLLSATTLLCVLDWTPDSQIGLVTSLMTSARNLGAAITNYFVTLYINPGNLKPDLQVGSTRYFSQMALIQRVPNVFLIWGAAASILYIVGFCLLKVNPPHKQKFKKGKCDKSISTEDIETSNASDRHSYTKKDSYQPCGNEVPSCPHESAVSNISKNDFSFIEVFKRK